MSRRYSKVAQNIGKMISGSSQWKRRKLKGEKRNHTLDYRTPPSRLQCPNAWPCIIDRSSDKSSTGKISWYANGKIQAKFEAMAGGTERRSKEEVDRRFQ
jgi:hypothetical protein